MRIGAIVRMGGTAAQPEAEPLSEAVVGTWHFPVVNLTVLQDWTVAGVTLRPVGWLSQHVGEALNARTEAKTDAYRGWLNTRLTDLTWSTAEATGESLDAARGRVQDAIALLRFYQRTALLYTSMERQTFGLADEIHPDPGGRPRGPAHRPRG
jgi:hypothetical protein